MTSTNDVNDTNNHRHTNKEFQGTWAKCFYFSKFSFDPVILRENICFFFHFSNHNEWFSLVFPLQYSLKEIEKNLSLVLQNYKLRYSWKFSWARKSCPKISLVFQKLGRSLENVEFSVSEQFFCRVSENNLWFDHYIF